MPTAPAAAPVLPPLTPLLRWTRCLAWWEGVSYLLLLGVAMPLKYGAGLDVAVAITGWVHGVLFIAVWVAALLCRGVGDLGTRPTLWLLLASLLPAGPFLLDHRIFKATPSHVSATLTPRGA